MESPNEIGTITISIPFPSKISDDLSSAEKQHQRWVADLKLCSNQSTQSEYEAAEFPLFTARVYPWANGPILKLLMDYIGWLFLWDDSLDKQAQYASSPDAALKQLEIFEDIIGGRPTTSTDPLVVAFRQLLNRVCRRNSSPTWKERHEGFWKDTFAGIHKELENNANKNITCFDDYLETRRQVAATAVCFHWIEGAEGFELPLYVHEDPMMLVMNQMGQDVINMENDVFSARKEMREGNTTNMVLVLAKEMGCSLQRAREISEGIIAGKVKSFLNAEQRFYDSPCFRKLTPEDQRNACFFITGMKDFMRGSHEWHLTSARYR